MMKTNKGNALTVIIIILAVIGVGWWMFSGKNIDLGSSNLTSSSTPETIKQSNNPVVKVNGNEYKLLVADTPETREEGLGGKESLPEDTAMIFVFEIPDYYEFWMKDMKFPIDIVWLDSSFKVVHIESNITPDTYVSDEEAETFMPVEKAQYVIEANALFAQKNNLKVGDTVEVSLKK